MTSINQEQARFNMVEQQVRTWDVLDARVLSVLHETPREQFVPHAYNTLAYADTEIKIGHGQTIEKPLICARLLQELNVKEDETVLEIGTGSGYLTALLAQLARHVYSIDKDSTFIEKAKMTLAALDINNVTFSTTDAIKGNIENGPFDAIACTASFPEQVPQNLLEKIKVGGRMFAVIGQAPIMEATLITRTSENKWQTKALFETETTAIDGLKATPKFTL